MKPRDYILSQVRHEETQPVPFTLTFEDEVGERLDAHYGGPAWRERIPRYMVEVAAVDALGWEPIDDALVRDPYGAVWRIDRRPYHLERPALDGPTFDGYDFPTREDFLRPEWKTEALRTCEEKKDSFIVAMLKWGLFEASWRLRGFENVLMDVVLEPDFYEELLDRLLALYLDLVAYTADLPVDAIMFGEDWGDQRGVILGPERWRRLLKPRWAQIYDAVHAAGKIVITHCCGSIADIMGDLVEIKLDVLESVQPEAADMNPYELKRQWGDKITFWGGLGSQSTIPFGTPDDIHAEVQRLCRGMARGGGYILAPAKPLQPETPTENAAAVLEAFTSQ